MGKAGQALKQVLELYNIRQSQLAKMLGVERPIVFRWFHERIDPTAETVAAIVQVLKEINPSASQKFVQVYLGDVAGIQLNMNNLQLPNSEKVNVAALSQIFSSTTNSYKYLFFLSLLDILKREKFKTFTSITFENIIIEMLANAWYSHSYSKLSFGIQDQIADRLDSLQLEITEPILKFTDPDKSSLRRLIQQNNLKQIIAHFKKNVPFRLIRPFLVEKLREFDVSNEVVEKTPRIATEYFEIYKPLYRFNATNFKDSSEILLHPDWIKYLQENYAIVRGWASWEWLNYMQKRNPNIPNLVNKLFMPQKRDSLAKPIKYWKAVLKHQDIDCIYSQTKLDLESISLDHYLPWSFVAHDQPWNLIPTTRSVNSAKSNNLPASQYFEKFVRLQHIGLTVSAQHFSRSKWLKEVESFITDLRIDDPDNLLDFNFLLKSYENTVKPLIALAENQGFVANWLYTSKNQMIG
ncbi:HNH endonuclease domain-containing protein [Spirulina sp. CCNP1310]|uniref:HNH endonuclease domain-containing protein n=1 Tax=Spirulina sp. CCNP1310 TaxID=3110249 RepID=UPI002B2033A0|nr:HNH endonuclease domain-containing protein [Spirulina sp. CCNP1310]MEA5417744.1 HNH endonuclease domain-containing protein [Spirulina sp. CCNP1310]